MRASVAFSLSFWLVSKFWNSVLGSCRWGWWLETFFKLDREGDKSANSMLNCLCITAITHFWTVCGSVLLGKRKGDVRCVKTSLSFSSRMLAFKTTLPWLLTLSPTEYAFMLIFYSWRGLTNFVISKFVHFRGPEASCLTHEFPLFSSLWSHPGCRNPGKISSLLGCPLFLQFEL